MMETSHEVLLHEVPLGLDIRPIVVIRQIPGITLRAPTRAVILIGGAALIWCLALIAGAPWDASMLLIGIPAALITWLSEGRIRGRRPLVWVLAVMRHHTRTGLLGRTSCPHRTGRRTTWHRDQ